MSVISMVRKSAVAAGAVAMMAGLGVAATAGTANAAGTGDVTARGQIEVCAHGNYAVTVKIPQAHKTFNVKRSACGQVAIPEKVTHATVYGHPANHPSKKFFVGNIQIEKGKGWHGFAVGHSASSSKLEANSN